MLGLLPLSRLVETTRGKAFGLLSTVRCCQPWSIVGVQRLTRNLPVGEMAVTLQDVSLLLGLPLIDQAVAARAIDLDWRQVILQRFDGVLPPVEDQPPQVDFTDRHGPTKAWLL